MPENYDEYASALSGTSTSQYLTLLEIYHNELTAPIRVVSDNKDFVLNGKTFTALRFGIKLPVDKEKQKPRVTLTMDNVGRVLTDFIDQTNGGRGAQVRIMHVLRDKVISENPVTFLSNTNPNLTVDSNNVVKTGGLNAWDTGQVGDQLLIGDGRVSTTVAETNANRMIGLNITDSSQRSDDLDYAIHLQFSGNIGIRENGHFRGDFSNYQTGDVLSIERAGTQITYLKNGEVFYISTVLATTADLFVDMSIQSQGGTLNNIVITKETTPIYYDRTVNLDNVQVDSQQVVGQLGYDAVLNEAATKIVFRPKTAPGLY